MLKAFLVTDAENNFHYTTKATDKTPKGTLMLHYALEGTKEELTAYEEAKGEFFSVVKGGVHNGKPLWFTSRTKLGAEVDVAMSKEGYINPVETIDAAIAKSEDKKLAAALQNGNKMAELEVKAKLAAKYGAIFA